MQEPVFSTISLGTITVRQELLRSIKLFASLDSQVFTKDKIISALALDIKRPIKRFRIKNFRRCPLKVFPHYRVNGFFKRRFVKFSHIFSDTLYITFEVSRHIILKNQVFLFILLVKFTPRVLKFIHYCYKGEAHGINSQTVICIYKIT